MAHAPPSANASAVDPEGLKDLSLVFALHPPALASARDRAAAGYFPRIRSDELDVPLPPRGLHVVTARDLPQVVVDDDPGAQSTDESSELPSPDPSSPGLHTPMDSPPVTHALSMGKDDVPDIGHLFIHNRAPASSVGGSDSGRTYGAIGVKPPTATSLEDSEDHQVPLFYKLVVALCDNEGAYRDDPEGSAEALGLFIDTGLGASDIQQAYSENLTNDPPNFLAVLRGKLKEIPPSRAGEDIAMFFCLRFAPQWYQDSDLPGGLPIQSWLSFNVWPCKHQPKWNPRKIIVRHSRPRYRDWAVYLRSIKFARVESHKRPARLEELESKYLEGATINFVKPGTDWGLRVLLDTGCSATYLPPDAVQSMNKNLFGNKDALKEPQDNTPPPTYNVDPNCWLLKEPWKVQVVYEFLGDETTPVFVTGPLEGFAYQRNPHSRTSSDNPDTNLEGLVFSSRAAETRRFGVLGQNFFQTMYISLHKATDGVDFVRMAGQWPERLEQDLIDYYVAGVSSK
ncbi:hypothetical protein GSI_09487 [Ganoderma sinense ZZ0214-1]|uniref:Uncharacterized protein n=1 Tax=Ganoderma sinense ZZ0214-1 TaxID=1077348 RepID=A0A2G8S3I0_9APHY|nr:hypothetical protein GSI_09487 [Ganoderma sinense ZZ0214-1]